MTRLDPRDGDPVHPGPSGESVLRLAPLGAQGAKTLPQDEAPPGACSLRRLPALRGQALQGAHVVEPVGQLHQDDAGVLPSTMVTTFLPKRASTARARGGNPQEGGASRP